ncbi:MAG: bifunctional DNA primase/polymerase [Chloroflexi bacterium]|nr:bifunctional DNA primase/polymerase [Chloroflexota bacterium]
MTTTDTTMLLAALSLADRGFSVFPTCWPVFPDGPDGEALCACGAGHRGRDIGKAPVGRLAPHGFKAATTDKAIIAGWWTACPQANVAVATGAVSGLVVLDIDPAHGGMDSLMAWIDRYGPLRETLSVATGGGGWHLYFEHPGPGVVIPSTAGRLGPGLDVRADGGYVVAPPSLHKSGRIYEWGALRWE